MVGASVCGIFNCDSCSHLAEKRCLGCVEGNKALINHGETPCGLYACATTNGVENCSACTRQSCDFYRKADMVCPLRSKLENARWWGSKLAQALNSVRSSEQTSEPKISQRTIDRLGLYLTALDYFSSQGIGSISSWQLSQRVGVSAPLIRKDLSRFGGFGTPSFGYDVKFLRKKIMDILHLDMTKHVIWLGAEKLREHAQALSRLTEHNCKVVAVLDSDPGQIGRSIENLQVLDLDNLPQVLRNLEADAAVIALQPAEAQRAATTLANMGIKAMLNLTPALLVVPDDVTLRHVDVAGELLALSYYCGQKQAPEPEESAVQN